MTDEELAQWQRSVEARIEAFAETRLLYVEELTKLQQRVVQLEARAGATEQLIEIRKALTASRSRMFRQAIAIGGLAVAVIGLLVRAITGG